MVQTRSQEQKKRASETPQEISQDADTTSHHGTKRKAPESDDPKIVEEEHSPKRRNSFTPMEKSLKSPSSPKQNNDDFEHLINEIVDKYGKPPMGPLIDDDWEPSEVVMVHILDALLSSARISHDVATATLAYLIEEGYHRVETLRKATWDEKTEVLKRGGYSQFSDKTAMFLEQLAELMGQKYDNDASKILPLDESGEQARATILERLEEIKGIGPVAVEIFLGSI